MRHAVIARNPAFDGRFLYGVITTGVFCRPSCNSRQARPENLRFFADADAARAAGFRPCKRCQPLSPVPGLAEMVGIARYVESHADRKLTLALLSNRAGLSPSQLQRQFKAAFGVSPKAYQSAARMAQFKAALKEGQAVTDAVYSAGFGSSSRLYENGRQRIGMTPTAYRTGGAGETLFHACRNTAFGLMMMAATDIGICFVHFGGSRTELLTRLRDEFPEATLAPSTATDSHEMDSWIDALDAYLTDGAPRPELPLDLRGTAFQILVWRFLTSLPEGDLISYRELATQLGMPRSARVVASACAANTIGVLVPCHRVLRGDGGLGGYRWGMERKRAFIDIERKQTKKT